MLALAWPSSSETAVGPHVSLILRTELDSAPWAPSAPAAPRLACLLSGAVAARASPAPAPDSAEEPQRAGSSPGRLWKWDSQVGGPTGTHDGGQRGMERIHTRASWKERFVSDWCRLKSSAPAFRNHFLAVLSSRPAARRAAVPPTGAAYLSLQTRGSLCARAALCLVDGLMRLACCPDF